jgi:hypothetical protein
MSKSATADFDPALPAPKVAYVWAIAPLRGEIVFGNVRAEKAGPPDIHS